MKNFRWADTDYKLVSWILTYINFLNERKLQILEGVWPPDPHGVQPPFQFLLWKLTFEKVNKFDRDLVINLFFWLTLTFFLDEC